MRTPSDAVESDQEQLDRQLSELLQELRVAMPGVQLLFGFLLAVPFNQRFAQVTQFQRDLYLVTLLWSGLASALFIAPTAYHRIMFRHRDKPQLIRSATRMTLAGLVSLALAMTGAVLLVTDFLFSDRTAAIVAAITLAVFGWLWFGIALSRRLTGKRSH
jgi:positive regulator of sigma E activity